MIPTYGVGPLCGAPKQYLEDAAADLTSGDFESMQLQGLRVNLNHSDLRKEGNRLIKDDNRAMFVGKIAAGSVIDGKPWVAIRFDDTAHGRQAASAAAAGINKSLSIAWKTHHQPTRRVEPLSVALVPNPGFPGSGIQWFYDANFRPLSGKEYETPMVHPVLQNLIASYPGTIGPTIACATGSVNSSMSAPTTSSAPAASTPAAVAPNPPAAAVAAPTGTSTSAPAPAPATTSTTPPAVSSEALQADRILQTLPADQQAVLTQLLQNITTHAKKEREQSAAKVNELITELEQQKKERVALEGKQKEQEQAHQKQLEEQVRESTKQLEAVLKEYQNKIQSLGGPGAQQVLDEINKAMPLIAGTIGAASGFGAGEGARVVRLLVNGMQESVRSLPQQQPTNPGLAAAWEYLNASGAPGAGQRVPPIVENQLTTVGAAGGTAATTASTADAESALGKRLNISNSAILDAIRYAALL